MCSNLQRLTCSPELASLRVAMFVVVGVGGFGRRLGLRGGLSLQFLSSLVHRFGGRQIIWGLSQLLQTQVDRRRSPEQQTPINFRFLDKMYSELFKRIPQPPTLDTKVVFFSWRGNTLVAS